MKLRMPYGKPIKPTYLKTIQSELSVLFKKDSGKRMRSGKRGRWEYGDEKTGVERTHPPYI